LEDRKLKFKFALLALLACTLAGAQTVPVPISTLPQLSTLAGTELYPLEQFNGQSASVSSANIANYVLGQLSATEIINLWNCPNTGVGSFLGANGSCQTAGSGTGVGNVVTTGSPVSGNLTMFSGATSITNSDLYGDCTTSGTLSITCSKTNGVPFGSLATASAASPPALGTGTPNSATFSTLGITSGTVGSPTGGNEGAGSLNMQACYINGVACATGTSILTSISVTVPPFLSVSPSTLTSNGTFAFSYSGSALPVLNGGTGSTTATGSGAVVLASAPTIANSTLTGTVSVPTASTGDSSSMVASTSFVNPGTLFAGNGYTKLPSGLIFEWGIASVTGGTSPTTVSYTIAFPHATLQVVMSPQYNGISPAFGTGTYSTTGFQAYGNSSYTWTAIGY
jgi:hypothetical protein